MADYLYNVGMSTDIEKLTQQLAAQLSQNERKICTAESCTGGLIAKTITDQAGSSHWFDRGFVTYTNQSKVDMLGVNPLTLEAQGAVSKSVAGEMAVGAVQHSEADVAIAVTGIAGPGGGSELKPVGTVCLGFAIDNQVVTEKQLFQGNRQQIRNSSLIYALQRVIELIKQTD